MRDLGPAILGSVFLHALVIALVGISWSGQPELVRPPKVPPHVRAVVMSEPASRPEPAPVRKAPEPKPPEPRPKPAPKPAPKPKPAARPEPVPEPARPVIEQPSLSELLAEETEALEDRLRPDPMENSEPADGLDEEELATYEQAILNAINNRWIIPSSLQSHDGLRTEVQIRTVPGGEVVSVTVTKSSGYPVLDDSAVTAVKRASPLPVPSGPGYERFRTFRMGLTPDFSQ